MFAIKIPLDKKNYSDPAIRRRFCKIVKEAGATGVLLVFCPFEDTEKDYPAVNEAADFFRAEGLTVSVWYVYSLGHGNYDGLGIKKSIDYNGEESRHAVCPMHENFVRIYTDALREFVRATKEHCRELYFDDDYRINWICSRPYCFCEEHMAAYCRELGEKIDRETLRKKIFSSAQNRYKDAYLKVNAQLLRDFSRAIRAAVDSVDEGYNIGLASGPSLWGVELVNGAEIAEILRAKDKCGMLRLSGGPYWCMQTVPKAFDLNLGNVIDFTRRQAKFCKEHYPDVQVLAEADSWPRVRYVTPASYLENFALAVWADENFDGMFKYFFTCRDGLDFDAGYYRAAAANLETCRKVGEMFRGKKSTGIHPYESIQRFRFEEVADDGRADLEKNHINGGVASRFLNDLSVPTTFEPDAPYAVFGDNGAVFVVSLWKSGAFRDVGAAPILPAGPFNVGLRGCDRAKGKNFREKFDFSEETPDAPFANVYAIAADPRAKIESVVFDDENRYTGAYFYENLSGERFYVLPFSLKENFSDTLLCRTPVRQEQVFRACELIGGPLDAVCRGVPYLYVMTKADEKSLAVGLWNFSADRAENLTIRLRKKYSRAQFLGCAGELHEECVRIERICSNEFAAVCLCDER